MAISVNGLFHEFGLKPEGPVKWGMEFEADYSGVYVVATTDDPFSEDSNSEILSIDTNVFENWLQFAENLEVNGAKVREVHEVKTHLNQFWNKEENILYIGESSSPTSSVHTRVNQYYSHIVGNKGPHTGGYWLKLLSCLDNTFVYYAKSENPRETEFKMIMKYVEMTTRKSFYELDDFSRYFPFANIKVDVLKRHSIKYATHPKKIK